MTEEKLVSVSAAAKALGKHPPMLYKYINEGMPFHVVETNRGPAKRIRVSEAREWLAKREARPRSSGGGGRATRAYQETEEVRGFVAPFVANPQYVLWHKGGWRGWAVAAVRHDPLYELDDSTGQWVPAIVQLEVDYTEDTVDVVAERLLDEVKSGRMFFAEPDRVLEFMAAQLELFEPAERPTTVIDDLRRAADKLRAWKDARARTTGP